MTLDPSASDFIQGKLRSLGLDSVTAVDAARWLDRAGVLRDSPQRPGKPLRDRLRAGRIAGSRQEGGRFWFIDRLDRGAPPSRVGQDEASPPTACDPSNPRTLGGARSASDEAYVIGLCDEILGENGVRQHRFPWLLGDPGSSGSSVRLPVDAYYPDHKLVVEYRESQHHEPSPFFDRRQTVSGVGRGEQRRLYDRRREEEIPRHGLRLVVVSCRDLVSDARGRLRRGKTSDRETLRRLLGVSD